MKKQEPASAHFQPIPIRGHYDPVKSGRQGMPPAMAALARKLPRGSFAAWGIPFRVGRPALLAGPPVVLRFQPVRAPWLVFLHAAEPAALEANSDGFYSPARGHEPLGELLAHYVVQYQNGREVRLPIRRRREIIAISALWRGFAMECVPHVKPSAHTMAYEQPIPAGLWGVRQTRVNVAVPTPCYGVWAWANPFPAEAVVAVRLEPAGARRLVVGGLTAGMVKEHPLRWRTRRKALLTLPAKTKLNEAADAQGRWEPIDIDLGQIIAVTPQRVYPNARWRQTYNNQLPETRTNVALVEYASHPEACFHLPGGRRIPVAEVEASERAANGGGIRAVRPADQMVTLRVVEKGSRKPVAVRLHAHGAAGEYLAPIDRHRQPNPYWFEDYSVDYTHLATHHCAYIPGETRIRLPLGRVYVEISKGFEIRPIRAAVHVTRATRELRFEIDRVLPWRAKGWVTADTHVHFLSPDSALLEGAGEGVNVVNLLASQWGELMTNVGDFDGRTTHGARAAGGDGEHLVRVGTENRQPILGHISLLGYRGAIIAPMTTAGPGEAALGDPVECLLAEWARQCRRQGGLVVLPHFPYPRAENALPLIEELVDGVEMTSWGSMYNGIDPYSLSDWYRFLNCGHLTAAVAGTDKMAAVTAVGTVRTYARIDAGAPFTYETWKQAVRRARTFVTYGPLLEFSVEGRPAGSRLRLPAAGGTLQVEWEAASVTTPLTSVELVVNGEIRARRPVAAVGARGHFSARIERSSWLALLARGKYPDRKNELIAAHSSPVMVDVQGSAYGTAADMLTILDQLEGSLAYLDTIGTRAETAAYRRMRLLLTAAHRRLHNRLHRLGRYHRHAPTRDHAEHRKK
jgi:hypothetical protein